MHMAHESHNLESDTEPEREFLSTRSDDDQLRLIVTTVQREQQEQIHWLEKELQEQKAEKQTLEVELGRQSFLEDKQKRSEKIFQISRACAFKQNGTLAADGASHVEEHFLSGADPLDLQGPSKYNHNY